MPAPTPSPARSLRVLAMALVLLAPTAMAGTGDGGDGDRQSGMYVEPGLEYVAVAPPHLARQLQPLIEWKMDRGVPAQTFNIEQLLTVYPGRDDAERLHNFLQDLYYNETDGTPMWLLLAGDVEMVPVRYLWADRDHTGITTRPRNLFVGDMYYSGLESDWDNDGDGVFGEPGEEDPTPELFVGRIAANDPKEMADAVAKTLAYELDPPGGDWFQNALLAGALMDEPNRLDDPFTLPGSSGHSDEGYDPHTDNAYEITQKVRAVLGEGYDIVELNDYPFFEGCRYNASVDTLAIGAVQDAWNRGNGLVFMASHGYEAFGALAEYAGTGSSGMFESARPFFTWQDAIVNITGGMLPLVYISSCYAGQFDKEDSTNFESMLTVPDGGAIALVAGDGDTFRLENISRRSFGNWWLSERFWQLVLTEGRVRPGEALGTLKSEYHTYYLTEGPPASDHINMDYFYSNLYSYNLQGDPEVPVWVATPDRLELEVLGGAVFNSPMMRYRVSDEATGEPVGGATVHARGAGLEGLLEAVTDVDGLASFPTGPTVMGEELRIVAAKEGWVPDREVVTVPEGVKDLTTTDPDLRGPEVMDFDGEEVTFEVTVTNAGDFPVSTFDVRFDSGDHHVPVGGGAQVRNQTASASLGPWSSTVLEFRHLYTVPGEYDVKVTIDPDDAYAEANELNNEAIGHLSLRAVPTLPATLGPIEMLAGQVHPQTFDLRSYIEMPEGQDRELTFVVGQVTDGVAAWIDPQDRLRVRPGADVSGNAGVEVRMSSDGARAGEMVVLLTVRALDLPPVIAPMGDQVVRSGQVLTLAVNASDPEGGPVVLVASLEDAIIADGVLTWDSTGSAAGEAYVVVTATDGSGASTATGFRLSVRVNNTAPSVEALDGEVTLEEGATAHMVVKGVDADGDRLTYTLVSTAEGFDLDPVTGLLTFDSSGMGPGRYTATIEVSDGLASSVHEVDMVVEAPSSAPVLALLLVGLLMVAIVTVFSMLKG